MAKQLLKDQFYEGVIVREWGSQTGFTVSPVPSIDKVKLSILQKNTNGKDCLDFYMGMEEFRQFCEDIDNGLFQKKVSADIETEYPSAYKFVTGQNGSKRLSIGLGRNKKAIAVQIQKTTDQKTETKFCPVSWPAMRAMSFYFKLVIGLVPCSAYYKDLSDAFWSGYAERQKFHENNYGTEDQPTAPVEQPSGTTAPAQTAPTASGFPFQAAAPAPAPAQFMPLPENTANPWV